MQYYVGDKYMLMVTNVILKQYYNIPYKHSAYAYSN